LYSVAEPAFQRFTKILAAQQITPFEQTPV
jgi:hypothetical protein